MSPEGRQNLELAVDLLKAAREITAIAATMKGDKAHALRAWADRFTDRGLAMVVRDMERPATQGQ